MLGTRDAHARARKVRQRTASSVRNVVDGGSDVGKPARRLQLAVHSVNSPTRNCPKRQALPVLLRSAISGRYDTEFLSPQNMGKNRKLKYNNV